MEEERQKKKREPARLSEAGEVRRVEFAACANLHNSIMEVAAARKGRSRAQAARLLIYMGLQRYKENGEAGATTRKRSQARAKRLMEAAPIEKKRMEKGGAGIPAITPLLWGSVPAEEEKD